MTVFRDEAAAGVLAFGLWLVAGLYFMRSIRYALDIFIEHSEFLTSLMQHPETPNIMEQAEDLKKAWRKMLDRLWVAVPLTAALVVHGIAVIPALDARETWRT